MRRSGRLFASGKGLIPQESYNPRDGLYGRLGLRFLPVQNSQASDAEPVSRLPLREVEFKAALRDMLPERPGARSRIPLASAL
jgi:hypothetical protein